MGQTVRGRIIVLTVLLVFTGIIISWNRYVSQKKFEPSTRLMEVTSEIPNWQRVNIIPLNSLIIETLQLDDYANVTFSNNNGEVFLYIGQYFSNQQIGAAHDPMVCFPGQGWKISQRTSGNISVPKINKNLTVSYSSMVTELSDQKNLVIYWFQSYDSTHCDTFSQKLSSLWNVLTGRGHANAFVRISTSFENNKQLAEDRIFQFIKNFYPIYLNYITSKPTTKKR